MKALWLPFVLVVAACQVAEPTPVPLRGEPPRTIAVWPRAGNEATVGNDVLLDGLEAALHGRGYQVVASRVAAELLQAASDGRTEPDPAAMGQVLVCDAVLQLVVREFTAAGTRPLREARWDLEWRLVSTRGEGVVWSFSNRGSWFPPQGDFGDPHRPLDAERDIVPIGGDPRITYRNANELAASLHRMALSHLPPRSR